MNVWATLVQKGLHGSTHNVCGFSQMGTEGWKHIRCSLLLPFSSRFTENSPHHKRYRMSPTGAFLLSPPPSSRWPPGLLAATAADLLSKCVRQQGQKPSLKLLVNLPDGLTPDATRPIRRQWFIWCFNPFVMKRESMGSHGCLDGE